MAPCAMLSGPDTGTTNTTPPESPTTPVQLNSSFSNVQVCFLLFNWDGKYLTPTCD